jgi:small subunit ribosomal protein S6
MRHYETIYILDPNLTLEDCKEVIKKYNDLVEKQKGTIIKVEGWGNQKFAYAVKKFDKGSYFLMNYCGDPGVTSELERDLKLDDRVLKYQTVKLGDKVDPEALIRKEKEAKQEKVAPEGQALEKEDRAQNSENKIIQEVENGV